MCLSDFTQTMMIDGSIVIGSSNEFSEHDISRTRSILAEFETEYRLELPGEPPPFCESSAVWSAIVFYRASQLAVHRDLLVDRLDRVINEAPPDRSQPTTHYSVDLCFRFLPDLVTFASSLSPTDPLTLLLHQLSRWFPMSSVGADNVGLESLGPVTSHSCLSKILVDRIIAAKESMYLTEPTVRNAVVTAMGESGLLPNQLKNTIKILQDKYSNE